ncbi:ANK [Mytilus edulis]|uniref:ANK n=1 Tax=Mytilus edulis TaxID=6550 RepID=A0A8S3U065_MYTED|nr:ANK [Mytilus edulis]
MGADINKTGTLGFTPLHLSCDTMCDPAVLDLLLKNKPCINKRMYDGSTPLLFALYENNREAVKVLLSHSADCNIGFYDSQAIKEKLKEANRLTGNSNVNEENAWLQWLTKRCLSSVVDYVNQELNTVIDIIGGATPVHLMCFTNDIDMIRLLLERNPDINIRKEDGSTPLFVACMFGFIDIAKYFLNTAPTEIFAGMTEQVL